MLLLTIQSLHLKVVAGTPYHGTAMQAANSDDHMTSFLPFLCAAGKSHALPHMQILLWLPSEQLQGQAGTLTDGGPFGLIEAPDMVPRFS